MAIQYQRRIYRFIYSMVREVELAQDLTQDTFLAAYRDLCRKASRPDLTDQARSRLQTNLSAWLYTIARNIVLSELRRRKVVRFLPFLIRPGQADEDYEAPLISDLSTPLEFQIALRDELQQAMDKVGPDKLTALLLHVDGFSYKEICELTQDSMSNVKVKIHRAKERLRRELDQPSATATPPLRILTS